jgi:DNA (cytosine-5)-methyltransferase 1
LALWFVNRNPNGFRGGETVRINLDRSPCPTIMAKGIYGDWPSHYWLEDDGMATRVIHDTKGTFSHGDVTDKPCPAITIGGTTRREGGVNSSHYQVVMDGRPERPRRSGPPKPPYQVPPMAEIAAIPWNGFNVVSTFSGCGGSCLGYRMAGFRVLWANEFVPAAQEPYRANMESTTVLDGRDIRIVKPEEILAATGLRAGELDLFDGSPPCQAFSTAGKREKGWGKAKAYEHGAKQCNETLFDEYIRLLRGLRPKTFVAENVSGLIKGTAKGWFLDVLKALKESGYRVKAKLLDAQWLGVPQMRQRIIFVGVREDLGLEPVHPNPLPYRYSVRDALPWISTVRVHGDTWGNGANHPSPAIGASDANRGTNAQFSAGGWIETRVQMIVGNDAFEPKFGSIDRPSPTILSEGPRTSGELKVHAGAQTERRKFTIAELKRICAFPDEFVLAGSYAQQWERLGNSVPPLMMRAIAESVRDGVLRKGGL